MALQVSQRVWQRQGHGSDTSNRCRREDLQRHNREFFPSEKRSVEIRSPFLWGKRDPALWRHARIRHASLVELDRLAGGFKGRLPTIEGAVRPSEKSLSISHTVGLAGRTGISLFLEIRQLAALAFHIRHGEGAGVEEHGYVVFFPSRHAGAIPPAGYCGARPVHARIRRNGVYAAPGFLAGIRFVFVCAQLLPAFCAHPASLLWRREPVLPEGEESASAQVQL